MTVQAQTAGIGTLAYPFYVWQSSDRRPIPSTEDATGFEIDTRRSYIWHRGEWHLHREPEPLAVDLEAALRPILSELQRLRFGLETYLGTEFVSPDGGSNA